MNIDLSKLKRKPINLKTVQKARFLFPGWEPNLVSDDAVLFPVPEPEWDRPGPVGRKTIELVRSNNYGLRIVWSLADTHNNIVRAVWVLEGRSLGIYCRHEIYVQRDADFETLVRAAEMYLLRGHEKYSIDVFRNTGSDKEFRNFNEFREIVDRCMAAWKNSHAMDME